MGKFTRVVHITQSRDEIFDRSQPAGDLQQSYSEILLLYLGNSLIYDSGEKKVYVNDLIPLMLLYLIIALFLVFWGLD
jgi:hypothetical protein